MRKITILIVAMLVMFSSCKKDNNNDGLNKITVQTRVLSQDEKNLVEKMKCAAIALKETMKKDKELSSLFKDEVQGLYKKSKWKEAFSIKQLLNPKEPVFKSQKVGDVSGVTPKLCEKFSSGFIKNFKSASKQLKSTSTVDYEVDVDGLQIYYPYSEEFVETPAPNYTYTFAPLTNDAQNIGWIYDAATGADVEVIVNDEYAFQHPTLIIMTEDQYDAAPIEIVETPPVTPTGNITQVNIGHVRSSQQYGEIFTGGPDFRFVFFRPGTEESSYTTSEQMFTGKTVVPIQLSRINVRKHDWVRFFTGKVFCSNWISDYTTVHWGVYEDDSNNFLANAKITFDAKVEYKFTKLPITAGASGGVSMVFDKVGKDKVGEVTWDRASFMAMNNMAPTNSYFGVGPWEVLTDNVTGINYRIYELGAVSFTLPVTN